MCGTASPPQDNWLITQFINSTSTVQSVRQQEVYLQMTYAINTTSSCTGSCKVYAYVLETNEMNQSFVRNVSVFNGKLSTSLKEDGWASTFQFTPNASLYSGFYLAFRDLGTCISMYKVVVFYPICDAIFLEFGLNFTKAQMPEGASYGSCFPNMALNTTNEYVQAVCILRIDNSLLPTWTISENTVGCMCVPGYSFINRTTVDQCKGKCMCVWII